MEFEEVELSDEGSGGGLLIVYRIVGLRSSGEG